eukprot:2979634-Rhodomonas_salina.1
MCIRDRPPGVRYMPRHIGCMCYAKSALCLRTCHGKSAMCRRLSAICLWILVVRAQTCYAKSRYVPKGCYAKSGTDLKRMLQWWY